MFNIDAEPQFATPRFWWGELGRQESQKSLSNGIWKKLPSLPYLIVADDNPCHRYYA